MSASMDVVTNDVTFVDFAASMWAEVLWFLLGIFVIRAGLLSWLVPRKAQKSKQAGKAKHSVVHRCTNSRASESILTGKIRLACKAGKPAVLEIVRDLGNDGPFQMEGASLLLKYCVDSDDIELGLQIENLAKESGVAYTWGVYEHLLKLRARSAAPEVADLFKDMLENGFHPSEGFCGGILSRCAESRNFSLAEVVGEYLRSAGLATLTSYKTLMKVFACGDLPDRACDVYAQVIEDRIEPDSVMCACVMRFALRCGKMALCWDAFCKSPSLDAQQCISLVRAIGQDVEPGQVCKFICKMRECRPESMDASVYNVALDICLRCGDLPGALELFRSMEGDCEPDAKTYVAILKVHCNLGDMQQAKQVITDMEVAGHTPCASAYNATIAALTVKGDVKEAHQMIQRMDQSGVPVDQYTIAIMMKAVKQVKSSRDIEKTLALLDRDDVNICEDGVLLNTVLDALVYHQDSERLMRVVDKFGVSGASASVQTYSLLIRACGFLGRPHQCQKLWDEMEGSDITPSTLSLGCMVDALVNAGDVEKAVDLVRRYKDTVPVNTVIFSTLMKGFANNSQADRAMDMYKELEAAGLSMNLVAWTTLINSQARVGNMDIATELLAQMEKDGCEPNVITYSTLIKGHCHNGNMELALSVLRDMTERGLALDVVVFNTLLDGCVRHSHFDLADQFLADMDQYGIAASNFTLSIIVKLRGKQRDLDSAFHAVRTMPRRHRFSADAKVGSCLLSACFCNRAPDRAIEAFDEIRSWPRFKGFVGPDENTYSTIIEGLARCGRFEQAVAFVEEAYGLGGKRAPLGMSKGLRAQTLTMLFKEMSWRGRDQELASSLAAKLRAARVPF